MTQDEFLALIDRATDEGWKELDLSSMGPTELPAAIGRLSNLTSLDLWENQITEMPYSFAQLSK